MIAAMAFFLPWLLWIGFRLLLIACLAGTAVAVIHHATGHRHRRR